MFARVLLILGTAAVLVVLLVSCGGMSASDYVSRLESISQADLRAWKASYATENDKTMAENIGAYLAVTVREQKELQQIAPPQGFAGAHALVLAAFQQGAATSRSAIEALKTNDSEAYDAALQKGTGEVYSANAAALQALTAAANKAGVQIPQVIFQDFPTSDESQPN